MRNTIVPQKKNLKVTDVQSILIISGKDSIGCPKTYIVFCPVVVQKEAKITWKCIFETDKMLRYFEFLPIVSH